MTNLNHELALWLAQPLPVNLMTDAQTLIQAYLQHFLPDPCTWSSLAVAASILMVAKQCPVALNNQALGLVIHQFQLDRTPCELWQACLDLILPVLQSFQQTVNTVPYLQGERTTLLLAKQGLVVGKRFGAHHRWQLLRVIRAVLHLDHPHILPCLGYRMHAGQVIELVTPYRSRHLLWVMHHVHYSPVQLWTWWHQLTLAVAHAHALRVVHGSIDPENVFLTAGNQVQLGHWDQMDMWLPTQSMDVFGIDLLALCSIAHWMMEQVTAASTRYCLWMIHWTVQQPASHFSVQQLVQIGVIAQNCASHHPHCSCTHCFNAQQWAIQNDPR